MWVGLRVEWAGLRAVRAVLRVEWAGLKDEMDRTKRRVGGTQSRMGGANRRWYRVGGRLNLISPVGKSDLSLPCDIMGSNWQRFQRRR